MSILKQIIPHPLYNHIYTCEDLQIVPIQCVKNLSKNEKRQLSMKYHQAGFVIFKLMNDKASDESLLDLARNLQLQDPFVPNIYNNQKGVYNSNGVNLIEINQGYHRAFQTGNSQDLHSDGTLEEIGKVKTSILLCVSPASKGGETTIFNSVAAFNEMVNDIRIKSKVKSLLHSKALRRVAVNGNGQDSIGPAFSIDNKELISRFSLDNTSDWQYGFRNVPNLKEAFTIMGQKVDSNSPFYIETMLKENEGIIMANNKIAHGRKKYTNGNRKRKMLRGLFEGEIIDI